MKSIPRGYLTLVLVVLLLATGLRFYRLDAQSFWNDEGNSARIAERSVDLILAGAAGDIHPPGYYLVLSGWRALTGASEFALRAFSALAGVLLVAVTIRLGQQYFDRPAALFAGLLVALHSALVYYSQEARMYSLLGLLAALALLLMSRWLFITRTHAAVSLHGARTGLGYVVIIALGLWTHYAFPFALLAINLIALLGLAFHRRALLTQRLSAWLVLNALGVFAFLPWLPTAWRQLTGWPASGGDLPWSAALLDLSQWLTFGPTLARHNPWLLLAPAVVLLIGIRRRGQTVTPLFAFAIPALLFLVLGIYSETFAKFLIIAVPGLLLILANGLAAVVSPTILAPDSPPTPYHQQTNHQRLLAAAAFALGGWLLWLNLTSLQALYFNPAYARADYRQIAADLQAVARPGDAILLNAPNQWEVFTYYYPDGPNVYPVARTRPLDQAAQHAELEAIIANHDRLFVLYWGDAQSDPDRLIETWLNQHTYAARDVWYADVRLSTYAVPQVAAELETNIDQTFTNGITLAGFTLPQRTLTPGDILQLTLFWRTAAPLNTRYKVFIHLAPAPGQPPLAQRDSEPAAGLIPTTLWTPGETIRDNHGVYLPPDLPPGNYTLLAGLYAIDNATRLTLPDGADAIPLATIEIRAP